MMPQEERRLWLHTALAAFATGICFATTPELPQFMSAAIALLAGLSIAGYMGLVAYSQPEKLATSTFSTSSTGNEIHTIRMATPSDHDTEG